VEHKYSTNVLNEIFMYQLSLETSVRVKRKWNINVPLSGSTEYLYSNSKIQALFWLGKPAGVPQYLKQLDLHGRRQYWSRKILSISGLSPFGLEEPTLCANEAPYFASNFSREAITSARQVSLHCSIVRIQCKLEPSRIAEASRAGRRAEAGLADETRSLHHILRPLRQEADNG